MWQSDNLRDLLKEYNIRFKENSKSFILQCPYCQKDDKLYIRKDGATICYVCAASSNKFIGIPEIVLSEILPLTRHQISQKLREFSFEEHETIEDILAEEPENITFAKVFCPVTALNAFDSEVASDYLSSRGIDKYISAFYFLKYDTATRRVLFPVFDRFNGDLIGWQGRYIGDYEKDGVPKSFNSPNFRKQYSLFNGHHYLSYNRLIVTEGPIDCIKCNKIKSNSVATFGKIVSNYQVNLIIESGQFNVYLGLDRDAYIETMDLVQRLSNLEPNLKLYLLEPPSHREDLGESTFSEVENQFNKAPRITRSDFLAWF